MNVKAASEQHASAGARLRDLVTPRRAAGFARLAKDTPDAITGAPER
jgi:hypothetical protein